MAVVDRRRRDGTVHDANGVQVREPHHTVADQIQRRAGRAVAVAAMHYRVERARLNQLGLHVHARSTRGGVNDVVEEVEGGERVN